jgi:hypothetical protein
MISIFKLCFHCCFISDEINKIRFCLHMFLKKSVNQLNLLYIYNNIRELWNRHELFFYQTEFGRAASENFISFYIFNFGVIFYTHLIYVYFKLKGPLIL